MTILTKIDSNSTGLAYAEETALKTVSAPTWIPLEPNGYSDFGGQISTIARNPINSSRQRKKGVTTDLDASGGFGMDLTQGNLQELLQGFFFADLRRKDELDVAIVDGTGNDYEPASGGDGYVAGDLLFGKGFDDGGNNGLKVVTGTPTTSSVGVTSLVTASAQLGTISRVGVEMVSGDASIDVGGTWPKIVNATLDFTTLGLIVGEWIYIGGDGAGEQFAIEPLNNGFARIRSISANEIEFDKTQNTMDTDAGTGQTIRIFFGRVLKNELSGSIVRRSYQLERQLGAPDDALPAEIQSEYVVGSIPNEFSLNIPIASKVTADLSFVGLDVEQRTGATGVKSGTRQALVEEDAFNTSSDFSRIKLATVVSGSPDQASLFAFIQELTLTINNNVQPNKAVGTLGAFEASAGTFEISGSMKAYFADVLAVQAVRNNTDVTLDAHMVKQNKGVSIDIPLMSLGDGKPEVEQDQPITIPLTMDAGTGVKNNANADHTLLMCFFDYLPTLADA